MSCTPDTDSALAAAVHEATKNLNRAFSEAGAAGLIITVDTHEGKLMSGKLNIRITCDVMKKL